MYYDEVAGETKFVVDYSLAKDCDSDCEDDCEGHHRLRSNDAPDDDDLYNRKGYQASVVNGRINGNSVATASPTTPKDMFEVLKATCHLRDSYAGLVTISEMFRHQSTLSQFVCTAASIIDLEEQVYDTKIEMDMSDIQRRLQSVNDHSLTSLVSQFRHFHVGSQAVEKMSRLDELLRQASLEAEAAIAEAASAAATSNEKAQKTKGGRNNRRIAKNGNDDSDPTRLWDRSLSGTPLDVCINQVVSDCNVSNLAHVLFFGESIFATFAIGEENSGVHLILCYKNVERSYDARGVHCALSIEMYNDRKRSVACTGDVMLHIKTFRVELTGSTIAQARDISYLVSLITPQNITIM